MGVGGHPLLPPPSSVLHCEGPWARVWTAARASPPHPHTAIPAPFPQEGRGRGLPWLRKGAGPPLSQGCRLWEQHISLARGTLILWEGVARGGCSEMKGALAARSSGGTRGGTVHGEEEVRG